MIYPRRTCLAVFGTLVLAAGSVAAESEGGWALVQVEVLNSYPPEQLEFIDAALQALPRRTVAVHPGATLSQVIRDEYGFGKKNLPRHFGRFAATIATINDLASPEALRPGTIQVPALPPWGFASNAAPAFLEAATSSDTSQDQPRLISGATFTVDSALKPARTLYHLRVPVSELTSEAMRQLLASSQATLSAVPFEIAFDQASGGTDSPSPLSADQAGALRAALAGAQRDVRVFVLDAGWPDEGSWRESRAVVSELCAKVRRRLGLGPGPDLSGSGTFPEPAHGAASHVKAVQRSLAPFLPLTPRVKVIYVPLTRDQAADDVLTELATLGIAVSDAKRRLGDRDPPLAESQARLAISQAVAHVPEILARIDAMPAANGRAHVDTALLTGLFTVATDSAETDRSVFFVNESWTTADFLLDVRPPNRAIVAAAAGNVANRVVDAEPILAFAGFSSVQQQILAVMTLDATGVPACNTSVISLESGNVGAVGYPGDLGHDQCGTSFASPRVAWLLAARETLSSNPVENPFQWVNLVRHRLGALRPAGALTPASLLLDPLRYVTAP